VPIRATRLADSTRSRLQVQSDMTDEGARMSLDELQSYCDGRLAHQLLRSCVPLPIGIFVPD